MIDKIWYHPYKIHNYLNLPRFVCIVLLRIILLSSAICTDVCRLLVVHPEAEVQSILSRIHHNVCPSPEIYNCTARAPRNS